MPEHVWYFHIVVVNDIGQVVSGEAVWLENDWVSFGGDSCLFDASEHQILERGELLGVWNVQSHRVLHPSAQIFLNLIGSQAFAPVKRGF